MTVTITITDPTATEASALRAYLTALHGDTAVDFTKLEKPIREHTEWVGASFRIEEPTWSSETEADSPDAVLEAVRDAPSAADAGAPDFDSAGMPWDERIHASSRATVADGTWRKKRGVSDELVAEVERDLRMQTAAVITHAEVEGASMTVTKDGDKTTVSVSAEQFEVPAAPGEPFVPEADAPPPPPAPTANPFLAVMSRIGKSKLDKAKKDELLTAAGALDEKGAPSILVLNKRPELIDGFIALLDSEGM